MKNPLHHLARSLVFNQLKKIDIGYISIQEGGKSFSFGNKGKLSAHITVHDPRFYGALAFGGSIGVSEAFMQKFWSVNDLTQLIRIMAINQNAMDQLEGLFNVFLKPILKTLHYLNQNSVKGSRVNISKHYDLGNDFYGLWLDKTMTYSSAIFASGHETLEEAQTAKYASMVDQMGVKPGDHVLEIGCGWGGFAEYAAKERGLKVTCLTISQEQFKYAKDRIAAAGLQDMVTFKLQDYRDETGIYDGIASIEMFEAVGEKYWPSYFSTVFGRLKKGGQATLQIITVRDDRFEEYRKSIDFIQKYIFPGGMLPSPEVLRRQADKAGLAFVNSIEFGESYSKTLRLWHARFNDQWDQVAAMGFDDRFRRMWNFYLTSCAATFHYANCDVTQITLCKPA